MQGANPLVTSKLADYRKPDGHFYLPYCSNVEIPLLWKLFYSSAAESGSSIEKATAAAPNVLLLYAALRIVDKFRQSGFTARGLNTYLVPPGREYMLVDWGGSFKCDMNRIFSDRRAFEAVYYNGSIEEGMKEPELFTGDMRPFTPDQYQVVLEYMRGKLSAKEIDRLRRMDFEDGPAATALQLARGVMLGDVQAKQILVGLSKDVRAAGLGVDSPTEAKEAATIVATAFAVLP